MLLFRRTLTHTHTHMLHSQQHNCGNYWFMSLLRLFSPPPLFLCALPWVNTTSSP
jgi:hypothetical protein